MNLERSATHTPPRPGQLHDGSSATGHAGRDGGAAGADGGFLSVLAALDPLAQVGPMDISAASPGPQGGSDLGPIVQGVEPELPDLSQLLPDVGWQVDAAAWLAHLNRFSQWSSSAGAQAPESAAAAPADLAQVALSNRLTGAPSRIESDLAPALSESSRIGRSTLADFRPGQPASLEGEVSTLQAVLGQAAGAGSKLAQLSSGPVELVKPGVSRLPPEAHDLALPALPLDLPRPAVPSAPIDLPQPVALGSGAPSTVSAMRGQTRAPQAELVEVTAEAAGMGAPASQRSALDDSKPTQPQPAEWAKSLVSAAGPAQAVHDTKTRQNFVETHLAVPLMAGSSAAVPTGVVEGFSRSADRVVAKPTESLREASGEGGWSTHGWVSGRSVEAASATPNSALPTPEMMVAEQVSYWITGRVQNAELRLDVFGRQPVDVSISMHGSEAQVEFRTDQPEIRQVLEGAVAHLKDLLKEEGLSLAGVFVGSSGQQRQGGQGPSGDPREAGPRQAPVEVAHTSVTLRHGAGGTIAGRSVDLFV